VINMTVNNEKKLGIIITGASSGIGEAIALEMAASGHHFLLIGRNKKRLEEVAKKVEKIGGKATIAVGDVSNEKKVKEHYEFAQKTLPQTDVLIANAGVGFFANLEELTIEQYDKQFDTNVRGVFLWLKTVLPEMKGRNSGQIIVTSSNLGLKVSARGSIYAATKHAVQAMVGCLREELRGTYVKAATINPGSVDTPWFNGKDVNREYMLSAEDIAKTARFIIDQSKTCNIDHVHLLPGKLREK
jgi:NADP-dependent 3-hydroxy acid dehydrogenase YdfG